MAKQKKTPIIIDEKEYFYEDLTREQQVMINHISDLDKKISSSEFNLQQLKFGKQAFVSELKKTIE